MKIRLAPSVIGTVRNYIRNSVREAIMPIYSLDLSHFVNEK